jgi:putative ABC transport system permease protein
MYRDDRRSGRIISLFGFLSISISCLGLFGLVAFMAEQRTKEIGIRKVLGASAGRIVRLMSAEFAALVGIAVVIAWPIGHYLAGQWLGGFAYKIRLSWWIFAGSGLLILTLTLLTTGLRAVMAARADPVQSLRYE